MTPVPGLAASRFGFSGSSPASPAVSQPEAGAFQASKSLARRSVQAPASARTGMPLAAHTTRAARHRPAGDGAKGMGTAPTEAHASVRAESDGILRGRGLISTARAG